MDYTISNNSRLFDELLTVLNEHQNEPGVVEAIEDLKAAKFNYRQRSMDHMLSCLVLTLHDLIVHPPTGELSRKLSNVIHSFYGRTTSFGSTLRDLGDQYERQGGPLLTPEQAVREVDERRGGRHS
jgi:hypothetical protein